MPKETALPKPADVSNEDVGRGLAERIKEIRRERGLSLRKLAQTSGISLSTLSKVENNLATLTYPHLVRLANALGMQLSDLLTKQSMDIHSGRRAVTKAGTGLQEATPRYRFELLCGDLSKKRMNPGIMEITARTLEEAGGLDSHEGEEFAYVLSGEIELLTEDYRPTRLRAGDCVYLDSSAGHAYVNIGPEPARVLAVTTHMIRYLQHL